MRAYPVLLLAILLLLPPQATAAAQNDNGSGADAPDMWEAALDVPLAPIAGTLDPADGDHADWYRISFPPGKVVEWTYHSTIPESVVFFADDAGRRITAWNMWNLFGGNGTWKTKFVLPPGDALRVGILEDQGGGVYWMELRVLDRADVSLDTLTIERPSAFTDVVASSTLNHVVRVNVSNQGAGATTAQVRVVVTAKATGSTRDLGVREAYLAPGQRGSVAFEWSGLAQAGEMRVEAQATSTWFESRTDNNHLTTTSSVLLNHTGFGVDALNGQFGNGLVGGAWGSDGRSYAWACARVVASVCQGASDPVGAAVNPTGDAHGYRLAVSGTGTAQADNGAAVSGTGYASGFVAVSATGPATGGVTFSALGPAYGLVPISVLGTAEGDVATSVTNSSRGLAATSGTGDAEGTFVAISGTGNASCTTEGCVAVSGSGEATGTHPFGVLGSCNGGTCNDVEPTRDAESESVALSGTGNSSAPVAISALGTSRGGLAAASASHAQGGVVAASLTGDAYSPHETASVALSGTGDATGGFAATGSGTAHCRGYYCLAVSATGDAAATCRILLYVYVPCVAISGTGHAECTNGGGGLLQSCVAISLADTLGTLTANPGGAPGEDAAIPGTGDAPHGQASPSCAIHGGSSVACIAAKAAGEAANGGAGERSPA